MAPKADPNAKAKPEAKAKSKSKKEEKDPADEIPKVEKPDRDAHDAELNAKSEEIDKLRKQLKEVSAKIYDNGHDGKEEFQLQRTELDGLIAEVNTRMEILREEKKACQAKMGVKVEENRKAREDLRKTKSSIGYQTEAEIDARIREIEFKMQTESVPLKMEKELMKEMAQLRKNRPLVASIRDKEGEVANMDKGASIKDQLAEINKQITAVKAEREAHSTKYTALLESRKAQMDGIKPLQEERDRINAKIKEKIGERNAIRDAYREKEYEYNKYQQQIKYARQEKARAERELRNKEWEDRKKEREKEKQNEEPYVAERTLLEQTMAFCKNLLPKEEEKAAEKEDKADNKYEAEGLTLVVKKEERDEFYFAPTKKPTKAKAGKKGTKQDAPGVKQIKHDLATFTLFDKLKIDPPMTTDDLPATIERLEAELEQYKEKVKKWEEERDERKRKEELGIVDEDEKPADEEKKEEAEEKEEPTADAAPEEEG